MTSARSPGSLLRGTVTALLAALLLPLAHAGQGLPPKQSMLIFGQKIEYYDVGTGPIVVLLHGAGTSAAQDWGPCILPIAQHHRVLAMDQLGFGGSDKPLIEYGIQTWVDFLGEFLRLKQVENFTLAGESLGGWVAAQYAIQALSGLAPAGASLALPKPTRLILSDAAGHKHLAEMNAAPRGSVASLAGSKWLLGAIFHDPTRSSEAAVRAQFALGLSKGDGWTLHCLFTNPAIVAEAVDDKLGAITIPTLVVWGANDMIIPLADGQDFAARIAGAKLVVIPESGHASEIEKPDVYLASVLPFIDGP